MSNEENDFTVSVDGIDHKYSDLKDSSKQLVNHVRDLEVQIEQLNFRFEQLNASKTFFSNQLVASLSEKSEDSESAEPAEEVVAEAVDTQKEESE